jgi:hypothetical protein
MNSTGRQPNSESAARTGVSASDIFLRRDPMLAPVPFDGELARRCKYSVASMLAH